MASGARRIPLLAAIPEAENRQRIAGLSYQEIGTLAEHSEAAHRLDDLGHWYGRQPASQIQGAEQIEVEKGPEDGQEAEPPATTSAVTFSPVSAAARSLTLEVETIPLDVSLEDQSLTLDPGSDPQPGDRWGLDEQITDPGVPVRITEARLRTEQPGWEEEETNCALDFEIVVERNYKVDLEVLGPKTAGDNGNGSHDDPVQKRMGRSILFTTRPGC